MVWREAMFVTSRSRGLRVVPRCMTASGSGPFRTNNKRLVGSESDKWICRCTRASTVACVSSQIHQLEKQLNLYTIRRKCWEDLADFCGYHFACWGDKSFAASPSTDEPRSGVRGTDWVPPELAMRWSSAFSAIALSV